MGKRRNDVRLDVARKAAQLFLERGLAGTSGSDLARAAGLSERSIWRHFRSKENCVEPLFSAMTLRFHSKLRVWPRATSIETHLEECWTLRDMTAEDISDGLMVVRLLALADTEPALRSVWLMACHEAEKSMIEIIAHRLDRSPKDFDVRICAASVTAAIRVIDETISLAAVEYGQEFTIEQIVRQLAQAIRNASSLPICDPVVPNVFGQSNATPQRSEDPILTNLRPRGA